MRDRLVGRKFIDTPWGKMFNKRKQKRREQREVNALLVLDEVFGPADDLQEGDPCPSCGKEMLWDAGERMLYCEDDWCHG